MLFCSFALTALHSGRCWRGQGKTNRGALNTEAHILAVARPPSILTEIFLSYNRDCAAKRSFAIVPKGREEQGGSLTKKSVKVVQMGEKRLH